MTTKEAFLNQFLEKIKENEAENKMLKDAYEYNSKLPESFFKPLQGNVLPNILTANGTAHLPIIMPEERVKDNHNNINNEEVRGKDNTQVEYGRNKKLVVQILNNISKAMLKSEIVKEFRKITNEDEAASLGQVTNALASLSNEESVIGYKPSKGVKFRGKYWALYNWYENGNLIDKYKPENRTLLQSYLN